MSSLATWGEKLFPRERLRDAIIRRVSKRSGRISPPLTLEYRQIFVFPTLFGFGFAILLFFTALGGLNFSNNMALLLVFLVGTIATMSTLIAYRNLAGLRVESVMADPVFSGEQVHFHVYVSNPEDRQRFILQCGLAIDKSVDCVDIPAKSTRNLNLAISAGKRGWQYLEPFRLETRYPLGMFRCWSWVSSPARCLVYPRPAQDPPPLPMLGVGHSGRARKGEGDQVHGLRNYRDGDSIKLIAWRTSARHDHLYTREMEAPQDVACELGWDNLDGMTTEERLSVLTAWVVQADRKQLSFSLKLPGLSIPAGKGEEHQRSCLEALALYGL